MTQKEQQVHQLSVSIPATFSRLTTDTSSRKQPPLSVQGSTIQLYLKQTEFFRHISARRERIALDCRQSPQHLSKITSADTAHSFLSTRLPESSRLLQELTHSYTGEFICRATRFAFAEDASVIHNWAQELLSFTCSERHEPTHVNRPLTPQIAN